VGLGLPDHPTPAAALGLAHDEIFPHRIRRRRNASTRQRSVAKPPPRAGDRRNGNPALRFLEAGRIPIRSFPARYIEALIASHRGDVAGAIEKADCRSARDAVAVRGPGAAGPSGVQGCRSASTFGGKRAPAGEERGNGPTATYAEAERIAASSVRRLPGTLRRRGPPAAHVGAPRFPRRPDVVLRQAGRVPARGALVVQPGKHGSALAVRRGRAVARAMVTGAARTRIPDQRFETRAAELAGPLRGHCRRGARKKKRLTAPRTSS